jgi:hypothetical protein
MIYIEGQVFLWSYDSAPPQPPSALPCGKLSTYLLQSSCVSLVELNDGRGGKGGRGAESYNRKKARSSINHSIFSGCRLLHIG